MDGNPQPAAASAGRAVTQSARRAATGRTYPAAVDRSRKPPGHRQRARDRARNICEHLEHLSIGAMLRISRQQVINLRKSARERLARRMAPWRAAGEDG